MQRFVVVWCPELFSVTGEREPSEADAFEWVVSVLKTFSPHVHVIKPGLCAVPTHGPSRYFGGDHLLAHQIADSLAERSSRTGTKAKKGGQRPIVTSVGVADGLLCGSLAAREANEKGHPVIVAPGESASYLAPWPVAVLGRPELSDLLDRLGIKTLGSFADLPAPHVLDRFGPEGAACHQVARGNLSELPDFRWPTGVRIGSRLSRLHPRARGSHLPGEHTDCTFTLVKQPGLWGATARSNQMAAAAAARIQQMLGPRAVISARIKGGRGPADRALMVPWDPMDDLADKEAGSGRESKTSARRGPWPGQVPDPSPIMLYDPPRPADLLDSSDNEVVVSASGLAGSTPARLSVDGSSPADVSSWAGPWPCEERWWSPNRRRRARLQAVTSDGTAYLLVRERGRWWVEGIYD